MVQPVCPYSHTHTCRGLRKRSEAGEGKGKCIVWVQLYCPIKYLLFIWLEKLTKDSARKYSEVNELLLPKWWKEANLRCCEDTDPHIPSSRQPQALVDSSHQQPPLLTLVCCMKNIPCVCPDLEKKVRKHWFKSKHIHLWTIFSIHHTAMSHLPQRRVSSQGTPAFY